MLPSIPQLLIVCLTILLFIVPPILVLASKRSRGGARFGWFILTACFSWIGYAVFLIMTQDAKDKISE